MNRKTKRFISNVGLLIMALAVVWSFFLQFTYWDELVTYKEKFLIHLRPMKVFFLGGILWFFFNND